MAGFNFIRFGNWGSTMNKRAPQAYLYTSLTDNFAAILADGYFNERVGSLAIGDLIYVNATDKVGFLKVTAISPDVTTAIIDLEGQGLTQLNTFYYGKSGNDSNDGKNDDRPFFQVDTAIDAVAASSPGPNNRFTIQCIDGARYTVGVKAIPQYTTILAPGATLITGGLSGSDQSAIICKEIIVPDNLTGLALSGSAKTAYLHCNKISGGNNSIGLNITGSTVLYSNIGEVDLTGTGSKGYNLATGAKLDLECKKFRETVASTKDGSSVAFLDIKDNGPNADRLIYNEVGNTIIDCDGHNVIIKDSATGVIFTNVGSYPKFPNLPGFVARYTSDDDDVTGNTTVYTLKPDTEDYDNGDIYNTTTGVATIPISGQYLWSIIVFSEDYAAHNDLILQMNATGQTPFLWWFNPANIKTTTNQLIINACQSFKHSATDTVYFSLKVSGGADVIDVKTSTYISCSLLNVT